MLEEYQKSFDTVELNMSFYRFPSEAAVLKWRDETRPDFLFAVKMNREITHFRKLRNVSPTLSVFIERMRPLGDKLGPILVQLPPSLGFDPALLEQFLSSLPSDLNYTVEFRNKGWLVERTLDILRDYGVALCLVDAPNFKVREGVTAPFTYVRWHGTRPRYRGDYSEAEIREWVERLLEMDVERIFGYWNNDLGGYAPKDCLLMKSLLAEENKLILT